MAPHRRQIDKANLVDAREVDLLNLSLHGQRVGLDGVPALPDERDVDLEELD